LSCLLRVATIERSAVIGWSRVQRMAISGPGLALRRADNGCRVDADHLHHQSAVCCRSPVGPCHIYGLVYHQSHRDGRVHLCDGLIHVFLSSLDGSKRTNLAGVRAKSASR